MTYSLTIGSYANGYLTTRRNRTYHTSYTIRSSQPIGTWANGYQ